MFKKIVCLIALILFLAAPAMAIRVSWDANTDSATGYIVYYQQTGETTIYHENVPGRETTDLVIDNNKFQPGAEYSGWVTAYNTIGESGPGNIVEWTMPEFIPTNDPAPIIINIPVTPGGVTINVN